MQCFSIDTNGDTAVVSIREDFFGFFEDLYDTIDAFGADYVGLNPRLIVWVDNYARLPESSKNTTKNVVATNIAKALKYPGEIYGKVLFTGAYEGHGDKMIQPLADDSVETLQLMTKLILKEAK